MPGDGNSPAIMTTDTAGKVYRIGFEENSDLGVSRQVTNHHYFDCKDLNGDGKPEYIFLDEDKLTVYNNDQTILFTYKFGEPVLLKTAFLPVFSHRQKLGIVSRGENLIYLFNNTGELYHGFPLQGNTPFSIGNFGDSLSRFNLIVGSRDNFLYNYRVK